MVEDTGPEVSRRTRCNACRIRDPAHRLDLRWGTFKVEDGNKQS